MPRCVENIVRCHQLATDRVRKGQHPWEGSFDFLVKLKPLAVRHEEGDETVTAQMMADGFAQALAEVQSKVPKAKDYARLSMDDADLAHFVEALASFTVEYIEKASDIIAEFNDELERFYDWCDENRWFINII